MTKEITPEQRRAAAQKAAATYREYRAKQAEMAAQRREEQAATVRALRAVRDSADATPGEILEAVRLLEKFDSR